MMNDSGNGEQHGSGALRDVSDPVGALGSDPVKRRDAWLAGRRGRTYELKGDWHELRELGVLVARNRELSLAMDTADQAARHG
jgi:hypothetical protein